MSMRKLVLPLFAIIVLLGCTQKPADTQQPPSQPQLPQLPQLPGVQAGVNVAAQFAELGIPLTGTSDAITVKAKYPQLDVSGQKCLVELTYQMNACSDSKPSKSGRKYTWCKPPYQYTLDSMCEVGNLASELYADPHASGKRFTADVWVPWYEQTSDASVSLVLGKAPSKVTYLYATGDYQSSYPRAGAFIVFKDPSQYIMVEGSNAAEVLGEVRSAVGGNEYRVSDMIVNYIAPEWYGASVVPYVCYNPSGIVTIDHGEFDWKNNRLNAKFEQSRKLVSPASFVLGPVSPTLGGKQLESLGQPFSTLKTYQSHYQACKLACYETCNRDGVLVMTKDDCVMASTSYSDKPLIAKSFNTILNIVSKFRTFNSMKDFVCFGLFNAFGEDIVMQDHKTGNGFVYARPVVVDRGVEVVIAQGVSDPKEFIEFMINNKLNKVSNKYTLLSKGSSGPCTLYSWGNPSDFQGFAGHCNEPDDLTLMFFNRCGQGENCEPSAMALYDSVSK